MTRYICLLADLPDGFANTDNHADLDRALALRLEIRIALAMRYARFPYWKEAGAFLLWTCDTATFNVLSGHIHRFTDNTGLHSVCMLGLVLLDRDTYRTVANTSWGLYASGTHARAIEHAVERWAGHEEGRWDDVA